MYIVSDVYFIVERALGLTKDVRKLLTLFIRYTILAALSKVRLSL